jgi:hypothetical protein
MLFEYMVVKKVEGENVQQGIAAATGSIPECLQGHESPEPRVKKVDERQDEVADMLMDLPHEWWRKYAFAKIG